MPEHPVAIVGLLIVCVGVFVEFVAFAAMAFYPIRRSLPVASPIELQAAGCATFFLGVVVLFFGQMLA